MRKRSIALMLAGVLVFNTFYTSVQAMDTNSSFIEGQQNKITISDTTTSTKMKIMDTFKENKDKRNYKEDEVLVKAKIIKNTNFAEWLEKNYPIKVKRNLSNGLTVVKFDSTKYSVEKILGELNNDTNIEYAEPNYSTKIKGFPVSEPYYKNQWGLKNSIYSGVDINIERAWELSKGNAPTVVAVIDTGVDYNHEDLNESIWVNQGEVIGNNIDDDNNGYIDDYRGWNFSYGNNDPYDDNNHGTHISGIIAAENNGKGVVGVAPNTKIMPLKVGDAEGNLYNDDVVAAINYGLKKGVTIFNCSFSGSDFSQVEYDTMKNANALFIVAAGNEGHNNDQQAIYPANYELPNIISVGSIEKNGTLSNFSNYGIKTVDIAAPGGGILSTVPNGRYEYFYGTSMAAPHVAGAAALMLSQKPQLTVSEVKESILKNSSPIESLSNKIATGAIINVGYAMESITAADNEEPVVVPKEEPVVVPEVKENGWINKDNKRYYYKDGQVQIGWQTIDGKRYFFNNDGHMAIGWKYLGSSWYYLQEDGTMVTGWKFINGNWYYLEANGKMATGWKYLNNTWFYLHEGGDMATGWKFIGGSWYYLEKGGQMATGWKKIGQQWYYLQEGGEMARGWKLIGGSWYYLETGGQMATGWKKMGQQWYYLQQGGAMATGWKLINGKWYYLYPSGQMASNTKIGIYKLGPSGALIS